MNSVPVESVEDFITKVRTGIGHWTNPPTFKPWFRGQSDSKKPPTPSILRPDLKLKREQGEFDLATNFRLKAPAYSPTLETGRIDQWLILMRHHGVPTRLLDWTESPLAGLFFAVLKFINKPEKKINSVPGVWVLNPFALNQLSFENVEAFPNTWTPPADENFKIAFGTAGKDWHLDPKTQKYFQYSPTKYPFAFLPSYIHPRVASQKSCFTIHGIDKSDFEVIGENTNLIKPGYFLEYHILEESVRPIIDDLFSRGVTFTSLFPDLDNLAKDLKYQFSEPGA
ncbi:MAG: FRG domain-containing protein [Planctomycetota bacterium]